MFTGIVRAVEKVKEIKPQKEGGLSFSVSKPKWKVKTGESIAVNGVCSTVKKVSPDLSFEYMPETLEKTNLLSFKKGDEVNLEQSLLASDRLEGHIVLGHIDTTGIVVSIEEEGNSRILKIKLNNVKNFMKFLARKGSVTLEGISLTVVDVGKDFFTVKLIPYSLLHTNLKQKKVGDMLNIEFDVLAKYLERLISKK